MSVAKVIAIATCGDLLHEVTSWRPEERAGVWRGARTALAVTLVATIAFEIYAMSGVRWMVTQSSDGSGWAGLFTQAVMGLYLAPSTLVLTLPLGLVLFVASTFQGTARTAKLAIATMTLATLCSAAMFANLAWVERLYYQKLALASAALPMVGLMLAPPIVSAWWANGACATMAMALTWRRPRAQRQA